MSAFLEEYGKIIVVIIVIAALIGLAILFKSQGTDYTESGFGSFMSIGNEAILEATNDSQLKK